MKRLVLCFFLYIRSCYGVVIDCSSYNSCEVQNLDDLNLANMTKVTHVTVINGNFDESFTFSTKNYQIKSIMVHNSTFHGDAFEVLMHSLIKSQSHIKILDLSHNKGINMIRKRTFVSSEPVVAVFVLNVSGNQITELEPEAFTVFESLESLDLSHNQIRNMSGPLTVRMMFNLKSLSLDANLIDEIHDRTFKGLYNLETLLLAGNRLTDLTSGVLKPLKHLKVLDVSNNRLKSLEILSPKLKSLDIAFNQLEIQNVSGLDRLTHLKALNISNNPIGLVNNDTFRRLISLQELKMQFVTSLTLESNDSFQGLTSLKYFDLRDNHLLDVTNIGLNVIPNLILLNLDGNSLRSINASELPSSLRYVGLQNNSFSCGKLLNILTHLRDHNMRLYFTQESPTFGTNVIQGVRCIPNVAEECPDEYLYFYTWHTKLSSGLCLILAVIYVCILWRNKDAIRKIKDEEFEQETGLLNDDERYSSCSFNYDDLLEKEKSNEIY